MGKEKFGVVWFWDLPSEFDLYVWGTLKKGGANHFLMEDASAEFLRDDGYAEKLGHVLYGGGEVYRMGKDKTKKVHLFELMYGFSLVEIESGLYTYLRCPEEARKEWMLLFTDRF